MRSARALALAVSVSSALLSGCSSSRECRGIEPNGPLLTGTTMRRAPAPGCAVVEGIQLRSARLDQGVTLAGGESLSDVALTNGGLRSGARSARAFIGAVLAGAAETGDPVLLRIEDVAVAADPGAKAAEEEKTAAAGEGGVLLYRVSYQFRSDAQRADGWAPLCPEGGMALAVPGAWNLTVAPGGGGKRADSAPGSSEVTFACQGSAIAKCVTLLGYRPWTSPALDGLHQACVRAVRADYCGNGQSNTRADEQVNFYDSAGVQKDGAEWPLEAEWAPEGARCVQSTRLKTAPADPRTKRAATDVRDYISKTCPQVLRPCSGPSGVAAGATLPVLFTEAAPAAN